MHQSILEYFQPSRDELLQRVSELVDDSMLREIAEADCGEDAEEHLACLCRLRDLGEVPSPQFIPLEVLDLIKWSEPDIVNWKPGGIGQRGHIMRAFACAALLRMGCEPSDHDRYIYGENQALIQLVTSINILGKPFPLLTRRFLAWRLADFADNNEERPFFILALLLLALSVPPRPSEADLESLLNWLMEDEQRIRESDWAHLPENGETWLLGLTDYDLKHKGWKGMAIKIEKYAKIINSPQLRKGLLDVAHRLDA